MKKIIILLYIVLFFGMIHMYGQEKELLPNVVFILADDLGWADLPVYGNKFNEAPNISKLAAEGMKFTNVYAPAPVCSASPESIISRQYPADVGIIDFIPGHWRPHEKVNVPKNRTQYLPEKIITIGEAMESAGYSTGYFGKWHSGDGSKYHPSHQGFQEANVGQGYYNVKFDPPRGENSPERHFELLADFGTEFVEHGHRSVGRVLDALGLAENNIVIFFSDNGGIHERYEKVPLLATDKQSIYKKDSLLYSASSNKPNRGEKGTVYEDGIREPLIVKWPNKIKPGSCTDALMSSVDFFPTLVDVGAGTMPATQIFDGKSLVPELAGNPDKGERTLFWHYPVYHHMEPASAIRKGNWKLIQNVEYHSYELYNLQKDIGEVHDLVTSMPDKVIGLSKLLNQWRAQVGARLPAPNPDFGP